MLVDHSAADFYSVRKCLPTGVKNYGARRGRVIGKKEYQKSHGWICERHVRIDALTTHVRFRHSRVLYESVRFGGVGHVIEPASERFGSRMYDSFRSRITQDVDALFS